MAADPKTLDIREPQILRHFPGDPAGFDYHHRVLLEKCGPGVWVALSPDGDLERVDLTASPYIPLDRKASFPPAVAAQVYAFDPMTRGELESFRRRAKVMNNLFNDASIEEVEGGEWLIADPSRSDFGELVADADVEAGVVLRDCGIVEKDGEEVFIRLISTSQKEDWIKSKDSSKGDLRTLGDFRDGQGARFLGFSSAIDLMRSSDMTDWALNGPRAVIEYMKSVRAGSSDLTTYHLGWVRSSGINVHAAAVHEHRTLCDAMRAFLQVDQVDASNLLGCEILVRRLIQIETATSRSPASPDYSGLDIIMEQPIGPSGEAVTLKFSEWVGARLKERATVQKQARLYKEEFSKKYGDGDAGRGQGRGSGDGRGRGRGRGRAAANAAAASSS